MNCDELAQLLPELVDGTLSEERRVAAEEALLVCPECQRELELARQVRVFLVQLQAENEQFRVPAGFEARLLAHIRQQSGGLDLLDLSSKAFVEWLIELIKLIGGLIDPGSVPGASRPHPA
jgi:hypothetical protein